MAVLRLTLGATFALTPLDRDLGIRLVVVEVWIYLHTLCSMPNSDIHGEWDTVQRMQITRNARGGCAPVSGQYCLESVLQ